MATFKPANPDSQPPSVPSNLTATPASNVSVSLSWTRSTDNVGVTAYNVYRSTTTGFIPTNGNLIGQTAGTSFTDADLPPGSFYYLVTAQDQVGNVSQPSNEASASVSGDTTPPVVSLTAPGSGATVSGTVDYRNGVGRRAGGWRPVSIRQQPPRGRGHHSPVRPQLGFDDGGQRDAYSGCSGAGRGGEYDRPRYQSPSPSTTRRSRAWWVRGDSRREPVLSPADVSGHGLSGAIANATWTSAGKFGSALTFNGTNSWVTVADNHSCT